MRVQMKQVLASGAGCVGEHLGALCSLPRHRVGQVIWWQQHLWPSVKIAALVTQGRIAVQARLIASRNYGGIVPPKITCKG